MFDRINKGMYWDKAYSIVEGCSPVSAGCQHCWAAQQTYVRSHQENPKIKARYEGLNKDKTTFNGKIRLMHENINLPRRILKPTVWAVWNDLFHPKVPLVLIEAIWDTMMVADHHIYIILTKRPERMLEAAKYFCWIDVPHIWFGVSVEDQKTADERIPELLKVPAAVRIVSIEPMLGPVGLTFIGCPYCGQSKNPWFPNYTICRACGKEVKSPPDNLISWVICGGETGPGARPMNPEWARKVRDQCVEAGVPYFHKQNGMWRPDRLADEGPPRVYRFSDGMVMSRCTKKQAGRLLDGRMWDQFPEMSRD